MSPSITTFLHDDADQACPGQIALAELRTVQILVDVPCHAPHSSP